MEKNKQYIVLSRQDAVARNNSPYVNLKIKNENDVENICVFYDLRDQPYSFPKVGELVRFTNYRDNQGKKSANKMEIIQDGECPSDHPLYQFIPRATDMKEWERCITALLKDCSDKDLIAFIDEKYKKLYEEYTQRPAATSVHHAYEGGLLTHTYQMLHMLEKIYPVYPYQNEIKLERIIIGILFHDWGKFIEYNKGGEKQEEGYLLGHIYSSAHHLHNQLENFYKKRHQKMTNEDLDEIYFIVHCVLAHHGQLEFGSPVLPCIPEAQLINYLDNISAKADIFSTTGHMEKAFALGTSVVKKITRPTIEN